jgi:hypothetical protein
MACGSAVLGMMQPKRVSVIPVLVSGSQRYKPRGGEVPRCPAYRLRLIHDILILIERQLALFSRAVGASTLGGS